METKGKWGEFIAGVGVDFAEVFDEGQEEYIPGLPNVVQTASGEGAQEHFNGKTGAGELQRFDDGDDLPGGERYPTYKTTVAWTNYGKYIDVTKNTIEDRDFQSELDEFRDLSVGANYSQDRSAMQLFNGGFATTVDVNGYDMTWYGDGVPLFSTVHPTRVPGASTQSNASGDSIPLDGDNLEVGFVALRQQQTDDGIPLSLMGKPSLVVPSDLMKEAEEITQSELDPETAENAINVYNRGMKVDMITSIHLDNVNGGSDTAWFLTVPQRARLVHFVRQEPRMEMDVNVKNKVATFTIDARWADGVKSWKRTWGSQGDNSSYSS